MNRKSQSFYFCGVDPAPSMGRRSDDGAIAIGRAVPKAWLNSGRAKDAKAAKEGMTENPGDWVFQFVYAMVLRGASIDHWSGMIHHLHRRFGLMGLMLDPGGGGQYVQNKLREWQQVIHGVNQRSRPIACPEDRSVADADYILHVYKRGDVGVETLWPEQRGDDVLKEAVHVAFQEGVEHANIWWPRAYYDRPQDARPQADKEPERYWSIINLDAMRRQLMHIQVLTREDGSWLLTRNSARQFVTIGDRDDLAMCGIYAYARFLIWLRACGEEFDEGDGAEMVAVGEA